MTYSFSHIAVVSGFCYFSFWSFRVSIRNTDCIIWWHAPLVFLQFFTVAVLKSVNTKPSFSIWVSWARSFFMLGCPVYQGHDLSQLLVFYLKCTVGLPLLAFCRLSIFLIHQLPPHTFPLVHLSLLLSVLWYRSSTHHGACAPWRGIHSSDHFISKCEKWFIVMCKHWNLPPVLTLAQHKYVTVRTEWMWVYLKYWKKGKIISANYVLKECTFSTFSMLVLMAKSGIWCFSNLGKL